ncbi:hypothetical protein GCM10025863_10760 [Microbacterium suwonense]|uniref:Uncharacterized protein n=1 Tax=Microbacterium suwonense TaxID=683047 RepID=A0ABM8FSQ0_9MICO|nr:hypothetical protein GCM10025863_10760 [Microbacterium suwonense]
MHRLQANIEIDALALFDGHDALAPFLGQGHREAMLAHLARLADDVADGQDEGSESGSHPAMLPARKL